MIRLGIDDETPLNKRVEKPKAEDEGFCAAGGAPDDLDDAIDMLHRVEAAGDRFITTMQGPEVEKLNADQLIAVAEMKAVLHEVTHLMDNHRGNSDDPDHEAVFAMVGYAG